MARASLLGIAALTLGVGATSGVSLWLNRNEEVRTERLVIVGPDGEEVGSIGASQGRMVLRHKDAETLVRIGRDGTLTIEHESGRAGVKLGVNDQVALVGIRSGRGQVLLGNLPNERSGVVVLPSGNAGDGKSPAVLAELSASADGAVLRARSADRRGIEGGADSEGVTLGVRAGPEAVLLGAKNGRAYSLIGSGDATVAVSAETGSGGGAASVSMRGKRGVPGVRLLSAKREKDYDAALQLMDSGGKLSAELGGSDSGGRMVVVGPKRSAIASLAATAKGARLQLGTVDARGKTSVPVRLGVGANGEVDLHGVKDQTP